jgi:hypothetical protein
MRSAPIAVLLLSLSALCGCRCRTEYHPDVTKECMEEALASRGRSDGGPVRENEICKECCVRRGLQVVDPGGCECGKLGVDALFK